MPPSLRSSRPNFWVDSQEEPLLSERLTHLCVQEGIDGLSNCVARFGNWGASEGTTSFVYYDRKILDFGKSFSVRLDGEELFSGKISAVGGRFSARAAPEITLHAEDHLQDLRMTRRTRSFEQKSDADIARQIADDHGLQADVQLDGPTYKALAQVNESDLSFLRRRALWSGAEIWLEGSSLKVFERARRAGQALVLTMGNELREVEVLADLAHQRTDVSVTGWDVSSKERSKGLADASALGSEAAGGESGAEIVKGAFGERHESVVHPLPATDDEARAEAEALFRLLSRRFVVLHATAEGDSRLRVGRKTDLQGLGPLFSGEYMITATELITDPDDGLLKTHFVAERAFIGRPGGGS